jgi:2-polyprenyl-3-methyl-5-hydroxy-6-metoxy-1,4-benzoquinol methylase
MSDVDVQGEIDPDKLKMFSLQLFTKLEGAVTAGMVHLGDQLGLYVAMRRMGRPVTSAELAAETGLAERWVREWAHNQAAAKLVVSDDGEHFVLAPEAAAVLADPNHPAYGMGMFHRLPQTMRALEDVKDSFRTGIGHDYDSHGPEGAVGIERSFEPWNRVYLLPVVLPALEGVVDKLERGATVADVGCGAGGAVLLMAEAFPASTFTGYDISRYALDRAEQRRGEVGVVNAQFCDPRESALPTDHSVDVITTFDCIHDMTHPQEMIHAIRDAIADDGTWLLVDIKGRDSFAENVRKNPMASLMYGISVLSCMSSALSEPDGAGLGTLGLPESRAREMAAAAGFTRFRKLDIDHPINAFYEVRP